MKTIWLAMAIVCVVFIAGLVALRFVQGPDAPAPMTRVDPALQVDQAIAINRNAIVDFDRAYRERDQPSMQRIYRANEWLTVHPGQTVRVVFDGSDYVQVDVVGGPLDGRRGWIERSKLSSW